jgi:hypothetical protein
MGHLPNGKGFDGGSGLNLDNEKCRFAVDTPVLMNHQLSDRTMSMISMVLYFDEMNRHFKELSALELELADMRE